MKAAHGCCSDSRFRARRCSPAAAKARHAIAHVCSARRRIFGPRWSPTTHRRRRWRPDAKFTEQTKVLTAGDEACGKAPSRHRRRSDSVADPVSGQIGMIVMMRHRRGVPGAAGSRDDRFPDPNAPPIFSSRCG